MSSAAPGQGSQPTFSVIVPAYNEGRRVETALRSLWRQQTSEPFEVIVVDSGSESCLRYVRSQYPGVRVVRSQTRLRPGAARNAGLRVARGEYLAFLPADGAAVPGWLEEKLRVHREGFEAVAGSILNGTPTSYIGTAGYLLEYSALLPERELLAQQDIPHALSFHHSVFERLGLYPEDTDTGEDTIFNRRCLSHGISVGFAPQAGIAHDNLRSLGAFLRHADTHGRGLCQCVVEHGLRSAIGPYDQPPAIAALRMLFLYPFRGWTAKCARLARFAPRLLPELLRVSPVVLLGLVATGWGALREWRSLRASGQRPPADGAPVLAGEPLREGAAPGYSRQRISGS